MSHWVLLTDLNETKDEDLGAGRGEPEINVKVREIWVAQTTRLLINKIHCQPSGWKRGSIYIPSVEETSLPAYVTSLVSIFLVCEHRDFMPSTGCVSSWVSVLGESLHLPLVYSLGLSWRLGSLSFFRSI